MLAESDLSEYEKKVAVKIIKILSSRASWTKKHCHIETLTGGFPEGEKGLVLAIIKNFVKKGWLEQYVTKHDFQVKLTKEGAKKFWPLMKIVEEEIKNEYGLKRILKCVVF